MKNKILISLVFLLSSYVGIVAINNYSTDTSLGYFIILEKKFIANLQVNVEFRWLKAFATHYNSVVKVDIIESVVNINYGLNPKDYSYRPP